MTKVGARTFMDDAAVGKHIHPVCHIQRMRQVLLNQHDRCAYPIADAANGVVHPINEQR